MTVVGARRRVVSTTLLIALALLAALVGAPRALAATVPSPPASVTMTSGNGSITVTWEAARDGGSPITGYVVDWGATGTLATTTTVPGALRTVTFDGLTNGLSYWASVCAVNAEGRSRDCQGSTSMATPGTPGLPEDLVASQLPGGTVRLSWLAADGNGAEPSRYHFSAYMADEWREIDTASWVPGPEGPGRYWVDLDDLPTGAEEQFHVYATNRFGSGAAALLRYRPYWMGEMPAGHALSDGAEIRSPDGRYSAVMQDDGNFVVYADGTRPLWDSRTWRGRDTRVELRDDGDLVVFDALGWSLWDSGTAGNPRSRLAMQDDGNLVLYAADGAALWSTGWDRGAGVVRDTMWGTQQLTTDRSIVSRNGRYTLVMQPDGNLVVYAPGRRPVWDARSYAGAGRRMVVQADGNVVVYNEFRAPVWDSGTWGNPGARLALQDDGNLVLYSVRGEPLWSSGWDRGVGAPRDTLWATQQLTTDQSLVSRDGRYTVVMQADGNLVLYAPGRQARWSTNTWNGLRSRLSLQIDGNAVLVAPGKRPLWDSRTWGQRDVRLTVQDDGNLVVYAANGRALWSSMSGRTY
ncbi:fibronectin type III domain-containing protein [Modestobacter sp. L9-4]|uniref:fibronectin type III domain-containing protein n=1 Tax=Modestobacter sp. L9-4 TaxID=2851567 RepID=UPI001C75C4EB|nr:fibronectin type III domain-containing protein [Modestobacter sp. L9-4]QXG74412.1 fibronectin type III domain-containing protein [Modestobacter sp. L9-4]